jgi:hypothetical protein
LPRFEHFLLVLIACDIGLYIQVFPTVLHSVVALKSMQVIPLFSTSSSKRVDSADQPILQGRICVV